MNSTVRITSHKTHQITSHYFKSLPHHSLETLLLRAGRALLLLAQPHYRPDVPRQQDGPRQVCGGPQLRHVSYYQPAVFLQGESGGVWEIK